ncbi:MAG: T9SS type A sorting domain-containing protein, partial [Dysgonomonas sp.]|nr:T9SS type A sorting domain-containing protein [Dysgonomonas sp.]
EDAVVSFQLYSIAGEVIRTTNKKKQQTGMYSEGIDCSSLRKGTYVLRINANKLFVNEIILKK